MTNICPICKQCELEDYISNTEWYIVKCPACRYEYKSKITSILEIILISMQKNKININKGDEK